MPKSRRWLAQANELGFPFRVALPTYTNQILTNSRGEMVQIISEETPALTSATAISQFARSDAREIASFLEQKPPTHLLGWIWYRLPLSTDRRNWRWKTLEAVIAKQPLRSWLIPHLEGMDLTLENAGNIDAMFPVSISASWATSHLSAADALPGWTQKSEARRILFGPDPHTQQDRLPPGGKLAIGWVRLDPAEKIHVQIP